LTGDPPAPPLPAPKRHIAAIPSWYSSGRGSGGGYFRDQALALQAAGHRVAILAPDIHTLRDLRAGRVGRGAAGRLVVEHDGIEIYRRTRRTVAPRLPYRNALGFACCSLALFAAYAERNGMPDLVHAHCCLNAGVAAALIAARHGVPFVLTEHSTGFAEGRLRWWERDLVRRVVRRAAACVAVSPHLAALLERQFPGRSWAYVPNVLGAAFLAPAPAASRPAGGRFAFLCAARMVAAKNHALLIEAFADAFAGRPDRVLQLVGDGPLQPTLERQCAVRGVAAQVEFAGVLSPEALREKMVRADAFVLASDVETFGVVVIEARAAGLPVVATASGGPDHLVDAASGRLVPVGDRAAQRDALLDMAQRAGGYDRARISADAIRNFGPEAFVRRFADVIPGPLRQP
jgi:glycosyltransferase involved in cell wall biosynthesis